VKRVYIIAAIFLMLTVLASGIFLYDQFKIMSFVLRGYDVASTPHFTILHMPESRHDISIVGNAAESTYKIVGRDFNFFPEKKTAIVVFPNSASLQREFNWPSDDNTQGAYYRGIIYIQSPESLFGKSKECQKVFFEKGPLVHEYTHLAVDYLTSGNHVQWFTEGVAQLEEQRVTGYTLRQDFEIDLSLDYSYEEMFNSFAELEDVPRAYIKALDMANILAEEGGMEEIRGILGRLKSGESADMIFLERMANKDSEGKSHLVSNISINRGGFFG
jgi:hypothetical protein